MKNSITKIHKEIEKAFVEPFLLMQQYGIPEFDNTVRYFAADVIANAYNGRFLTGLACACQSFMNARLLHGDETAMTPEKVLLGDYFVGLVAGFELPENSYEILEKFSGFVEEDIAYLSSYAARKQDLSRFERLFSEVAEVAYE